MQGWDSCTNCAILMQFAVPSCTRNLKLSEIAPHREKSTGGVNFFEPEVRTYHNEKLDNLFDYSTIFKLSNFWILQKNFATDSADIKFVKEKFEPCQASKTRFNQHLPVLNTCKLLQTTGDHACIVYASQASQSSTSKVLVDSASEATEFAEWSL